MDKHVRGIQTALHGKVAENVDYDLNNYKGIQNVLDLKAKNRAYEQEVWNNSPMKKSGEYIGDAVDGVKGYITGNRPPEKITDEVRKARILKAMDFAMKELGMTKEQAAGLVGNFLRESQLVTTAKNPDSPATGIAQWLGVRRRAFEHGKLSEKEKKLDGNIMMDQVQVNLWEMHPLKNNFNLLSGKWKIFRLIEKV